MYACGTAETRHKLRELSLFIAHGGGKEGGEHLKI